MFTALKRIFIRKKSLVTPVITVTVNLDNRCGEEIASDMKKKGCSVTQNAKNILSEIVSKAGLSCRVGLIRGEDISHKELTYSRVRRFGKRHGYKLLPVEVGSFLRENISNEELKAVDIWWVGCMSKVVEGSYSYHDRILGFGRNKVAGSWFGAVETHFVSDIGSVPLVFRKGGAYAFLLPNSN